MGINHSCRGDRGPFAIHGIPPGSIRLDERKRERERMRVRVSEVFTLHDKGIDSIVLAQCRDTLTALVTSLVVYISPSEQAFEIHTQD